MIKNLQNKKLFFAGTPFFAKEILAYLLKKGIRPDLILTQIEKPQNRGLKKAPSEVKIFAQNNNLKILELTKFDSDKIAFLKKEKPDIILTAAFGKFFPYEVLKIPLFGCVNIHPSLLPKFRGPSPIQTVLLEGEKETGVSIMLMNEKMDAGPIIYQKKVAITPQDDYNSLEKKLIKTTNQIIIPVLEKYIHGILKPQPQKEQEASFCSLLTKKMGHIDWKKENLEKIIQKQKAFIQWPKIFSFWEAKKKPQKLIFHKIYSLKKENFFQIFKEKKIGEVLLLPNKKMAIRAKNGFLVVQQIQLEGKRPLSAEEFLRGKPKIIGEILK